MISDIAISSPEVSQYRDMKVSRRLQPYTIVPAGHQSWTVVNITVCNVEVDHDNNSIIEQTLVKVWLFNSGFRFFKMPRKPDFQFRLFDVSSVFLKPIPNRLSGFRTSLSTGTTYSRCCRYISIMQRPCTLQPLLHHTTVVLQMASLTSNNNCHTNRFTSRLTVITLLSTYLPSNL